MPSSWKEPHRELVRTACPPVLMMSASIRRRYTSRCHSNVSTSQKEKKKKKATRIQIVWIFFFFIHPAKLGGARCLKCLREKNTTGAKRQNVTILNRRTAFISLLYTRQWTHNIAIAFRELLYFFFLLDTFFFSPSLSYQKWAHSNEPEPISRKHPRGGWASRVRRRQRVMLRCRQRRVNFFSRCLPLHISLDID